jgi:hypothetical protein
MHRLLRGLVQALPGPRVSAAGHLLLVASHPSPKREPKTDLNHSVSEFTPDLLNTTVLVQPSQPRFPKAPEQRIQGPDWI